MIRRPPRSTLSSSSAASDVYKRQVSTQSTGKHKDTTRKSAVMGGQTGARKLERQARASLQSQNKCNRVQIGSKGKTSRKHLMQEQPKEPEPAQLEEVFERVPRGRKEKLERQFDRLQAKNASTEKLNAKAVELNRAVWRDARVQDMGRNSGFKRTAPRAARTAAMISCGA
eukprot:TRINITY_DN1986_c0_g1_i3.p1 TRINITY_DN1986_c0_g1~~TRINITY_DN1986_c0_g1_i3.p1  ORF type:complete len:171 (-),score=32.91 TRINITY_DN1986_c0_g1_i3:347-859(-)